MRIEDMGYNLRFLQTLQEKLEKELKKENPIISHEEILKRKIEILILNLYYY